MQYVPMTSGANSAQQLLLQSLPDETKQIRGKQLSQNQAQRRRRSVIGSGGMQLQSNCHFLCTVVVESMEYI